MSLQGELLRDWGVNDYITGLIPSRDGNIFLFSNNHDDEEVDRLSCLKLSPSGDTLWQRLYPKLRDEYIRGGIPLSDNGFLALGTARAAGWPTDMLAVRFNASGDTLWAGTHGGDRHDRVDFAEELSDGSFLLAGELNVTDTANTDGGLNSGQQVYLVKISADGETQWTQAVGNTLRESPNALAVCSDGNYIYAATRSESYVYLFDETQGIVCKTNTEGEVLWQEEFDSRVPAGLRELESGEFLVAATELVESYLYGSDLHVIKLSASGTLLSDTALIP
jgi:outer membrane protein assembly factor BamB